MKYRFIHNDRLRTSSLVYAWRRDDWWLYVGATRNGFARFSGHNVIRDIQERDLLYVWYVTNHLSLFALERAIIGAFSPRYNKSNLPVTLATVYSNNPDLIVKPRLVTEKIKLPKNWQPTGVIKHYMDLMIKRPLVEAEQPPRPDIADFV